MNKNKALKITAWAVAGVALGGALTYYNFIHKDKVSSFMLNEPCPDFFVKTYAQENGEFYLSNETKILSKLHGKIVLVNFWYTTCGGCVEEMHYFDELARAYPEDLEVIAVAGNVDLEEEVVEWLNDDGWNRLDPEHDWKDFTITFGRNSQTDLFEELGGKGAYPHTVLVDREGIAVYTTGSSQNIYTELEAEILKCL